MMGDYVCDCQEKQQGEVLWWQHMKFGILLHRHANTFTHILKHRLVAGEI